MTNFFALVVLCFAAVGVVLADESSANLYTVDDMLELCEIRNDFDKESSVLCDPAGVIEFYNRNEIENMFDLLDVTRFNVIVVPGIANLGYMMYQSQVDMATHRFALDLFNGLNIIKDSRRYDRALIFISREQKSTAIICDSDMLPKISPDGLESVTKGANEYVAKGEINVAIETTVRRLNLIVSADGNAGSAENMEGHMTKVRRLKAWKLAPRVFVVLLVIFAFYSLHEGNVEHQLVKGKVTLGHILDELNRSVQPSSLQHRRSSCPTCLDRFTKFDGNCVDISEDVLNYTEEIVDTTVEKSVESDNVDDALSNSRKIDVNENHGCLLKCGHEYCQTCLKLHLLPKNGMMCPICSKSIELPSEYMTANSSLQSKVDEDDGEDSALLSSIHAGTDCNEILYRLERIKSLYPRVLSASILLACQNAVKANDLGSVRDTIQARFEEIGTDLKSREDLLKESVLGDRFSQSRGSASRRPH